MEESFCVAAGTKEGNVTRFQFGQTPSGATLQALEGRMFDTLVLDKFSGVPNKSFPFVDDVPNKRFPFVQPGPFSESRLNASDTISDQQQLG